MSRKVDLNSAKTVTGSLYPPPYDVPCAARVRRRLGDSAGLTQFGVNLTRLPSRRLVEPAPLAQRRG